MVKMIHRTLGTTMWVAENRVDEYTEAGHKLASDPVIPTEPEVTETQKRGRPKKEDK